MPRLARLTGLRSSRGSAHQTNDTVEKEICAKGVFFFDAYLTARNIMTRMFLASDETLVSPGPSNTKQFSEVKHRVDPALLLDVSTLEFWL